MGDDDVEAEVEEQRMTYQSIHRSLMTTSYTRSTLQARNTDVEEEKSQGSGDSWPSHGDRIQGFHGKGKSKRCKQYVKDLDKNAFFSILNARNLVVSNPKPISSRAEKMMNKIDRQLFVSDRRLTELLEFGEQLVTNIRVASDRHEYDRRQDEMDRSDQLATDIKRENIDTTMIFNDIQNRWKNLDTMNEPFALWEKIQEQKARIDEITRSKDNMIERCQDAIKRLNEQFDIERVRQTNDMGCLTERIDNQIEILNAAYKHHITLLESTIEDERELYSMNANEKWRLYYNLMNERFYDRLDEMRRHNDVYTEIIKHVTDQQEELVKETRVRLDKDCERLELELRKTKDSVLMNSEKLDYNYQVFQKRNEENTLIINQQKRIVAAYYVEIADLRHQVKDLIASTSHTIRVLDNDIKQLHDEIGKMKKNSQSMRLVNKKKFNRIWDLNYNELLKNVNYILDMDEMMYTQHLFIPYKRPNLGITNINLQYQEEPIRKPISRDIVYRNFNHVSKDQMRFLRNIFRRLSERGDFLLEKRLLELLETYGNNPKQFIRLENIFLCLRVYNVDDILSLTKVFDRYTYCPTCEHENNRETAIEVMMHDARTNLPSFSKVSRQMSRAIYHRKSRYHRAFKVVDTDNKHEKFVCPNHFKVMEPTLIRHAMAVYSLQREDELCPDSHQHRHHIEMDNETIDQFWEIFRGAIPEKKYNFWCRVEHGLFHYLKLLQLRRIYDTKCVFLRRQNAELSYLLKKFELDKVNV